MITLTNLQLTIKGDFTQNIQVNNIKCQGNKQFKWHSYFKYMTSSILNKNENGCCSEKIIERLRVQRQRYRKLHPIRDFLNFKKGEEISALPPKSTLLIRQKWIFGEPHYTTGTTTILAVIVGSLGCYMKMHHTSLQTLLVNLGSGKFQHIPKINY